MTTSERVTIPAGHGKAARLSAGRTLKLINTHGTQVVDFWAFNAYDLREYMCVEASRVWSLHLWPAAGDVMVTNPAPPDRHPGRGHHARHPRHDHGRLRPPALRPARLRGLSPQLPGQHVRGHAGAGGPRPPFSIPGSWNVIMNIPIKEDRYTIDMKPTECKPRTIHRAARGDGLLHGVLRLPAGRPADTRRGWRKAAGLPLRGSGLRL